MSGRICLDPDSYPGLVVFCLRMIPLVGLRGVPDWWFYDTRGYEVGSD